MHGPIPLIRTLPCVKGLYTSQQNYNVYYIWMLHGFIGARNTILLSYTAITEFTAYFKMCVFKQLLY